MAEIAHLIPLTDDNFKRSSDFLLTFFISLPLCPVIVRSSVRVADGKLKIFLDDIIVVWKRAPYEFGNLSVDLGRHLPTTIAQVKGFSRRSTYSCVDILIYAPAVMRVFKCWVQVYRFYVFCFGSSIPYVHLPSLVEKYFKIKLIFLYRYRLL